MKKKLLSAALVGAMVASLAGGATAVMAEEKTEITWWAFPTYTQENADDAVGTDVYKRQAFTTVDMRERLSDFFRLLL